ncbi:hypothetical protein D3C71_1570230 [compost metagenome]
MCPSFPHPYGRNHSRRHAVRTPAVLLGHVPAHQPTPAWQEDGHGSICPGQLSAGSGLCLAVAGRATHLECDERAQPHPHPGLAHRLLARRHALLRACGAAVAPLAGVCRGLCRGAGAGAMGPGAGGALRHAQRHVGAAVPGHVRHGDLRRAHLRPGSLQGDVLLCHSDRRHLRAQRAQVPEDRRWRPGSTANGQQLPAGVLYLHVVAGHGAAAVHRLAGTAAPDR